MFRFKILQVVNKWTNCTSRTKSKCYCLPEFRMNCKTSVQTVQTVQTEQTAQTVQTVQSVQTVQTLQTKQTP